MSPATVWLPYKTAPGKSKLYFGNGTIQYVFNCKRLIIHIYRLRKSGCKYFYFKSSSALLKKGVAMRLCMFFKMIADTFPFVTELLITPLSRGLHMFPVLIVVCVL